MSESPRASDPIGELPAYRVGTLVYTLPSLILVMFWMLLGGFCLQIMEQLPISLVPLQLRWATASDTVIGFLTGSLPAILGIILNPIVGMQSDRHRGRMGRRLPFLLAVTPIVMISLAGLGFADPISGVLSKWFGAASPAALKIGWIGGCMVVFVVANTYIYQVYQFLFVDVIPGNVMGRFVGFFRAIGALGVFAFNWFMFGHAEAHMEMIYIISVVLYGGSFFLLIWNVKEGEYEAPTPSTSLATMGRLYFTECFSNPFYLKLYSLSFFFWSAIVPLWSFLVFFGTKPGQVEGYAPTLGLSLQSFGEVRAWCALVQVPVYFIVGPFVDRFHPLRVAVIGMILSSVTYFANFFMDHDQRSLTIWLIINFIAQAIYMGAFLAIFPRLLPRKKYGQFFTANQIFGFVGVSLAPILCGWLLETVKDYRYIFVWCGGCTLVGAVMSVLLYKHWIALGGDSHYRPPGQPHEDDEVSSSTSH